MRQRKVKKVKAPADSYTRLEAFEFREAIP